MMCVLLHIHRTEYSNEVYNNLLVYQWHNDKVKEHVITIQQNSEVDFRSMI